MADESAKSKSRVTQQRIHARGATGVSTRTILVNRHVFREGEIGDLAFIIKTGTIEIYKSVDGRKVVLGMLGPGGMFGEMALIDDQPRMASARAIEGDAVVMVISRQMFAKKMAGMDPFARGLIKILSSYIRSRNYAWDAPLDQGQDQGEVE